MKDVPRIFQSLAKLRALNISAVGLALASFVTPFVSIYGPDERSAFATGVWVGIPTLVAGVYWAWQLRSAKGELALRANWRHSFAVATITAAVAASAWFTYDGADAGSIISRMLIGALLGVTGGIVVWLPALLLALVCFGLPLAHTRELARKGLAGEERGEWTVGIIACLVSLMGLWMMSVVEVSPLPKHRLLETIGHALMWIYGVGGAAAGTTATVLAHQRGVRRREFVADVEAGKVQGYRIDGRALVRVTTIGEGYRVSNFEEAIYEDEAPVIRKRA